jgi:predicted site-specific integrase-resolvase
MPEVRMSLAEAAAQLGIAPNSVRSRFKAGKLRGERDNSGRIWVWIDPSEAGSTRRQEASISKPSTEFEVETLKTQISDLKDQIADLREDRDAWRQQAQDLARAGNFWSLFRRR